jgi:hypothetical protein
LVRKSVSVAGKKSKRSSVENMVVVVNVDEDENGSDGDVGSNVGDEKSL